VRRLLRMDKVRGFEYVETEKPPFGSSRIGSLPLSEAVRSTHRFGVGETP
jgi:hypothetical protein